MDTIGGERILCKSTRCTQSEGVFEYDAGIDSDPAGNRTPNRQLRRLMLYPIELPDQIKKVAFAKAPATKAEKGGFEPPVRFDPYGGLANRWFKPLTHLSKRHVA